MDAAAWVPPNSELLLAHVLRVSSLLSYGIAGPCFRDLRMQSDVSCAVFVVLLQVNYRKLHRSGGLWPIAT